MKSMMRSKKGIIFTVLAIVLAIFFTVVFSAKIERPIDYKTEILETRVSVLGDYMESFFDYAEITTSIAGYSAFQGIIANMSRTRSFNTNFEKQYVYCLETGNLTNSSICLNMTNKTLIYYLDRIRNIAKNNLSINSSYIINNITINQTTDAFSVDVTINLSLNITDYYANLSDTRILTSSVTINGLLDPVYLLRGSYNQTVKVNTLNKREGDWNYTDLQTLYYNHTYRNYKEGISFINRIKGNFTPNIFGIESFVNYTTVAYNVNQSLVDFLYWRSINFTCKNPVRVVAINNTAILPPKSLIPPVFFQLDEVHRLSFNISSNDTVFTCPQT